MEKDPKSPPTNVLKLVQDKKPEQEANEAVQEMLSDALAEAPIPDEDGDLAIAGVVITLDRWANIRDIRHVGNATVIAGALSTVVYHINRTIWKGDDDE